MDVISKVQIKGSTESIKKVSKLFNKDLSDDTEFMVSSAYKEYEMTQEWLSENVGTDYIICTYFNVSDDEINIDLESESYTPQYLFDKLIKVIHNIDEDVTLSVTYIDDDVCIGALYYDKHGKETMEEYDYEDVDYVYDLLEMCKNA
jgi:hypothetical protein